MTMKLSEIRAVRDLIGDDWRDAVPSMGVAADDFEAGGYRFIHSAAIDRILVEDLKADAYVLGAFTDWAIRDATGWPLALIQAAQKGEVWPAANAHRLRGSCRVCPVHRARYTTDSEG